MKKTSIKGKRILGYLKKFSKTPTRSLARKIYNENIEYFKDYEEVRNFVKYYRGQAGDFNRKAIKEKQFFAKNLYKLPKSYASRPEVFHLPVVHNNVLVISDIHIPYHDIRAIEQVVNYGKKAGINAIFINGDLIDFYQISRFVKLEIKVSIKDELKLTREFLDYLNQEFPGVLIYYLMGNHDNRLQSYLATKAPELLDMEEFRLSELLDAKGHNMTVLEDNVLVRMGKLGVTHGHSLLRGFFSPVNPARGAFLKAKASVLIGHLHKVSTHSETTIIGKPITCFSSGCLCELNPRYSPFANNFTHGFAHVTFEQSGNFKVRNMQILQGEIVN